jgi:hypothetical protein
MIDHVWTVICSRSVIDVRSKNVSIQNVIEQVTTSVEPVPGQVISMPLEVVSLWIRTEPETPAKGKLRVAFLTPSGTTLGEFEFPIDLTEYERFRSQIRISGLPAEEIGRHHFYIDLQEEDNGEWQRVAVVPLTIAFRPQEKDEVEEED